MTVDESVLVQMMKDDTATYDKLRGILCDDASQLPQQFRALFTLKSLNTPAAVDVIAKAFETSSSALLKHELAYVLGQMGQTYAIPTLINVLSKKDEDKMVRHEAAEALGAIGDKVVLPVLREYLNDEEEVVRETCELAIDKICNPVSNEVRSAYTSVDPAPALSETKHDLSALKDIYLDPSKSLFERYRAMFTLRNIGTRESIEILCMGFNDKSALFRHEVAFVFGQMQREESVPALIEVLQRPGEVAMVRHEAAEALGSIATEECKAILADYAKDNEQVVKESCLVALDMLAYENSQEFHYSV